MNLQEWMDLKGWNDRVMAAEVKALSRSQINRIRNKGTTSIKTARKLAEVTNLPAECFLRDDVRQALKGVG